MSDRNPLEQSLKNSAESVADRASSRASDIKESVSDMARTAAAAVRDRADQLPGGQKVQQFAQAAAERLGTTADYVRNQDPKRMLADVQRVVRNNPGSSLVVAAALGFVIGRSLTRG